MIIVLNLPVPVGAILSFLWFVVRAAFIAPWVVLSIVLAAARRFEGAVLGLVALKRVLRGDIRCPQAHRTELRGVFECRSCGGLFAGWAFQRCPICGTSCGHVPCERCGMAVRNPLI